MDNLEQILQVPGADLVMVGPNDLSASIGSLGQLRHPQVTALFDRVAGICKAMGKPFGASLGPGDEESIRDWVNRGVSMLGCGDDIFYISLGCRRTFQLIKSLT